MERERERDGTSELKIVLCCGETMQVLQAKCTVQANAQYRVLDGKLHSTEFWMVNTPLTSKVRGSTPSTGQS